MGKKYANLCELLLQNTSAQNFYKTLPDYVQITIKQRGDNVCTEEALHNYADNLLRGDG